MAFVLRYLVGDLRDGDVASSDVTGLGNVGNGASP